MPMSKSLFLAVTRIERVRKRAGERVEDPGLMIALLLLFRRDTRTTHAVSTCLLLYVWLVFFAFLDPVAYSFVWWATECEPG